MGNVLTSNPLVVDTAATIWSGQNRFVRLVQWIDDAADIADDDDLVLTINGVAVTQKIQLTANAVGNTVVYQLGPFNPGLPINSFIVTTIDHGILTIWVD